jgi:CelD/BcsL family acetyltransferase involved in cellulose biosynthesis
VTAALNVEVLADPAGLDDLRDDWTSLLARAGEANVYLTPAWADAWWRTFGRGPRLQAARSSLHLIVVRRGSVLVGLAPLLAVHLGVRPAAVRILMGIGQENADFGGVLVDRDDSEAMTALVEQLASELGRGRTVLNLTRLEDASPFLAALRHALPEDRYVFHQEEAESYPYLDFSVIDDPERHLRKLLKKNDVSRRGRRLAEEGDVEWIYHQPGESDAALGQFLHLHDLRWAGRAPSGPFTSVPGREFLLEASRQLDAAGLLRISFVTVDGAPIVGRFGTAYGDAYQGMKSGWDPAFKSFGPGHLVVGRLLEQLLADGVPRFDFMRGAGEHKAAWTNQERPVGYWSIGRAGKLSELDHRALWTALRLRYRWRGRPVVPNP